MKDHVNIPIFIPHLGCEHACVFCNQKTISGRAKADFSSVETEIEKALDSEAEMIIPKIPKGAYVVPLCIEGKQLSSEELARKLDEVALDGKSEIAFIIGSSFGLSEAIKNKTDLKLSMSRMTFPHQLARVMLLEQLYRAGQIRSGGKYHK